MIARRLSVLLLLVAATASAQWTRHRGSTPGNGGDGSYQIFGTGTAMVAGTVSAVSGNVISLANGTVTLDASHAILIDPVSGPVGLTSLKVGTLVVASVNPNGVGANAPIPATLIAVSKPAAVTLTGPVTAVDVAHNTLTLLGRTIQVTGDTSFGTPFPGGVSGLAGVQPNALVVVSANPNGTQSLVAVSVQVLSISVGQPEFFHGTVRSIAADAWSIHDFSGDVTVAVNAQTQIIGNPKVGDTVDVLARTDSSGHLVALSIMKSLLPIFQFP